MVTITPERHAHIARGGLDPIQYLRGLAATMVVVYHTVPQLLRMGYRGPDLLALSSGVDVFFVISGFIMLFAIARNPGVGPGQFLLNRILRIVPLYWLLTSFMVAIALIAPSLMQSSRFELAHVIKSYLFIPAAHPVLRQWEPILVPGWTLNYEMFFYLLFAVGLATVGGRPRRLLMLVGAALLAFACIPLFVNLQPSILRYYSSGIILEFAYGMILCAVFLAVPYRTTPLFLILAAAGFLGLFWGAVQMPHGMQRQFAFGVPALMIVVGMLYGADRVTGMPRRILKEIGDASYSIYIAQQPIMSAVGQTWRKLGLAALPGAYMLFTIFGTVVCVVLGWLIYRYVEVPLTRSVRSLIFHRRGNWRPPVPISTAQDLNS